MAYGAVGSVAFVSWLIPSLAVIVSTIFVAALCACCKKAKGIEHQASIIRTQNSRSEEVDNNRNFKTTDVGRWDCLIDIDELEVKPPDKFIPLEKLNKPTLPPPPDVVQVSQGATMRYDRAGKKGRESGKETRSLYITNASKEQRSPTFKLSPRLSFYNDYRKLSSPPTPKVVPSPPPMFDHSGVVLQSPENLGSRKQSEDSNATLDTTMSVTNEKERNENYTRSSKFAPPHQAFKRVVVETPDVEVYSSPPIPPRHYLFFEEENEPVVLQSGRNSIRDRYKEYAYNQRASIAEDNNGKVIIPGFKPYKEDTRKRYSAQFHNYPSDGIAYQYNNERIDQRVQRPRMIDSDPGGKRSRKFRGIDNVAYTHYSEDEGRRSGRKIYRRTAPSIADDDYYDIDYPDNKLYDYARDVPPQRVQLRRHPYENVRLNKEFDRTSHRSQKRNRYSSYIPMADYENVLMYDERDTRSRGFIPIIRESHSTDRLDTLSNTHRKLKSLEQPVPKPRQQQRRSTAHDIFSTDVPNAEVLVNRKQALRQKIYKELKVDGDDVNNLSKVIDKILDVVDKHDSLDGAADEIKSSRADTAKNTEAEFQSVKLSRQRSSSLPSAPNVEVFAPVENKLLRQTKIRHESDSSSSSEGEAYLNNNGEMLKRFKGGIEEIDFKRRKKTGSLRRSLKKNQQQKTKNTDVVSGPEVVNVTVLPVKSSGIDGSKWVENELYKQTQREVESLERLQIQNTDSARLYKSDGNLVDDLHNNNRVSHADKVRGTNFPIDNDATGMPIDRIKPPVPMRSNPPKNRSPKTRHFVPKVLNIRSKSASPPVDMDTDPPKSPNRQKGNNRFLLHSSAPRSPRPVNQKMKVKESKSVEGLIGSTRRISRTGEIVRIPAEDEYAIPYDSLSLSESNVTSPVYSVGNRSNPYSRKSSAVSQSIGSSWSVNGLTPSGTPNGRHSPFSFDGREITKVPESGIEDDYDYANPIN